MGGKDLFSSPRVYDADEVDERIEWLDERIDELERMVTQLNDEISEMNELASN